MINQNKVDEFNRKGQLYKFSVSFKWVLSSNLGLKLVKVVEKSKGSIHLEFSFQAITHYDKVDNIFCLFFLSLFSLFLLSIFRWNWWPKVDSISWLNRDKRFSCFQSTNLKINCSPFGVSFSTFKLSKSKHFSRLLSFQRKVILCWRTRKMINP